MESLNKNCYSSDAWSCQCSLYTPSVVIKSLCNCVSFYSKKISPITQGLCLSIKSDKSGARFVSRLLLRCFPSNIARLVTYGIIYSAKGMIFTWAKSDIIQKVFKTFPSFANGNTFSSVLAKPFHRLIFTSTNHGVPSAPFFSSLASSRVSMREHCVINCLSHISIRSGMRSHYTTA